MMWRTGASTETGSYSCVARLLPQHVEDGGALRVAHRLAAQQLDDPLREAREQRLPEGATPRMSREVECAGVSAAPVRRRAARRGSRRARR